MYRTGTLSGPGYGTDNPYEKPVPNVRIILCTGTYQTYIISYTWHRRGFQCYCFFGACTDSFKSDVLQVEKEEVRECTYTLVPSRVQRKLKLVLERDLGSPLFYLDLLGRCTALNR